LFTSASHFLTHLHCFALGESLLTLFYWGVQMKGCNLPALKKQKNSLQL